MESLVMMTQGELKDDLILWAEKIRRWRDRRSTACLTKFSEPNIR